MRTAKCVAIVLIAALVGITAVTAASGQDNTAQQPSNMTADCLVKITVDPSVLPLNMETLEGLLHSSAVRGKAMTEVLGPGAAADRHEIIFIEWLSESASAVGARLPRSSGVDGMINRQLEEVYGRDYAKMIGEQAGTMEDRGNDANEVGLRGRGGPGEPNKPNSPRSNMRSGGTAGGYGMGGMGGGMGGGMMGGGGMGGGMGMGMGSIYGGMRPDMGGAYGAPTGSKDTSTVECSVVVRLTVALPDELKPFAKEFLDALVVNLRNSLVGAHDKCVENLEGLLASAKSQRDIAERNVRGVDAAAPGATMVREQLDRAVDLSVLSPQVPIAEAIEVLKNAVQPPLQIVALWKDLLEGASVEPSTPIDIGGMSSVRLGTALDLLLKGVSDPLPGVPPVVYRIRDNVIVIGTTNALGVSSTSAAGLRDQTDIRALAAQKNELARAIQSLELDLVSMEARRKAMYMQMEEARREADERLAQDTVTQELEKLVQMSTSHLNLLQQRLTTGQVSQADLAPAQEGVARARIELARRREELAKLTGGGRIEQYDSELSKMTIDEAENRARLEVLRRQLGEVQGHLTRALTFDPEAARMRIAQETLDLTNRRVGEIAARIAALQPPTVTVIGAN